VAMAAAAPGRDQIAAVLRGHAILRRVRAEVRADRASDDALALGIAGDRAAEFLDDPHRLVADRQARRDRILALEDVDVGAADGGGSDANERVVGTDIGDGFIGQLDAAGLDEYSGFHHGSHWVLLAWNRRGCGRVARR